MDKFKNVTINSRNEILNSTTRFNDNPSRLNFDLSSISNSDKTLTDCTLLAKHHPPKVIKQSNELTPEQHCNEYEVLYAQYLMTLYMKESLKKKMIDEDEIAAKEINDLNLLHENLQKEVEYLEAKVEQEETTQKFLNFIESFEEPIRQTQFNLNNFKQNYEKFSLLCEQAQQYLQISNVLVPTNNQQKETLVNELNRTINLLKSLANKSDIKGFDITKELNMNKSDIDFNMLEELLRQKNKLKSLILCKNGLSVMNNLN